MAIDPYLAVDFKLFHDSNSWAQVPSDPCRGSCHVDSRFAIGLEAERALTVQASRRSTL